MKPAEILNFKLQAPNLSIDLHQMYANEDKMLDKTIKSKLCLSPQVSKKCVSLCFAFCSGSHFQCYQRSLQNHISNIRGINGIDTVMIIFPHKKLKKSKILILSLLFENKIELIKIIFCLIPQRLPSNDTKAKVYLLSILYSHVKTAPKKGGIKKTQLLMVFPR